MKKKTLSDYIALMEGVRGDAHKAKRYGEEALRRLDRLDARPRDVFMLYYLLGDACSTLHEFSRSIDFYYKAYLLGLKEKSNPAGMAYLCMGMASGFIMTQHIDQALSHLAKVREYYRQYGDRTAPMDKRQYFFFQINLAYCYLHKKQMDQVAEIIEKELGANETALEQYKLCHMDYHHLKGEYLVETGDYARARQAFEEAIRISQSANFIVGELESRLHLAILFLMDRNIDEAVNTLRSIYSRARDIKDNSLMCEAGLLLSKCYSLLDQPDMCASIEKRFKPLLKNLDISWFYEKTREFDELYKLLQPIYKSSKYTPLVLINGVDRHYQDASYKNILIGRSPAMQKVYQLIEKIAGTDLPVLVQGQTGTGKELICRFLHRHSPRAEKPYLTLDCGALPENLLENELFGHIAGAYTGATEDKKGYVELASGGTLMLDEITNMSAGMQRKLLRVLEEKQIWPLGAEKPLTVDTRFVFASNQDVDQMMAKGILRSDLVYRINAVIINLPPLRERKEDIPLLVEHFLGKYAPKETLRGVYPEAAEILRGVYREPLRSAQGDSAKSESAQNDNRRRAQGDHQEECHSEGEKRPKNLIEISSSALDILTAYSWPGNVRELENEVQKICVLHGDEKIVTEDMLSEQINAPGYQSPPDAPAAGWQVNPGAGPGRTLIQLRDEFERRVIRETIKAHNGNIAEASRKLGYDRPSLYRKMKQLGMK